MVSSVEASPPAHIPDTVEKAMQAAQIILPDGSHTIKIKMAPMHPVADVISAVSKLILCVASSAITFFFAKRHIDEGLAFEPIRAALNAIKEIS
jgi:hypothetical protein